MLKIFKILYRIVTVAIIAALLILHFIIKETNYKESLLYYSLPLPLIIVVVLFVSIFLNKKKYHLILAATLLVIWLGRSFKIHFPETIIDTDFEVVFWNASRDNGFEEAFKLNKNIPDVLVLVESKKNDLDKLQLKYPSYFIIELRRGIYIFSKTKVDVVNETISNYSSSVINFRTKNINFYAIDVAGSTDVPREWELSFVNDLISTNQKTIVLGDFNVPFESKYLRKMKIEFNHAFNEKGNGFRETWFWNLPLLSLDHIWVSKDFEILKTQKINTFKSDHTMLKTYVRN